MFNALSSQKNANFCGLRPIFLPFHSRPEITNLLSPRSHLSAALQLGTIMHRKLAGGGVWGEEGDGGWRRTLGAARKRAAGRSLEALQAEGELPGHRALLEVSSPVSSPPPRPVKISQSRTWRAGRGIRRRGGDERRGENEKRARRFPLFTLRPRPPPSGPRRARHLRKPNRRVSGHEKMSLFLRLWSCECGRNLK